MLSSETNSDFTKTDGEIVGTDTEIVAADNPNNTSLSAETDFLNVNQAQTFLVGDSSP